MATEQTHPADFSPEDVEGVINAPPGAFARQVKHEKASCLAGETMAAMLAAAADLGEIIRAVRSAPATDTFNQFAARRRLIRKWAGHAAGDPFITRCLDAEAEHRADFERAIDDASTQLDNLRLKYEIENRGAHKLAIERGDDGRIELIATTSWPAMAKEYPVEAKDIHTNIAIAELAAGRIRHAAGDINRELVLFFAELVPKAFELLAGRPQAKRRELIGKTKLTPALAASIVEMAQATDFIADPAAKLGVKRAALPRRFRLLTALPEHKEVLELIVARRIQTARTVIVEPSQPNPESE